MTTVVNSSPGDSGSGMGMVVGAIILVAVVLFLIFYGFPGMRSTSSSSSSTSAPSQSSTPNTGSQQSGPNIQVPSKIDVNLNQNKTP